MLHAAESWRLASPDGKLAISVRLVDLSQTVGYPDGKRLYYQVEYLGDGGQTVILRDSPMGVVRDDQNLLDGLAFDGAGEVGKIEDEYTLTSGKRMHCRNIANEQTLTFRNAAVAKLQLILRAYPDGVAFRYRFPQTSEQPRRVMQEATGFALPTDARCWVMPYDAATKYTPAYEVYYEKDIPAGTTSPSKFGWALPLLFALQGGKHWALIAEADLEHYFGVRLDSEAPNAIYHIRMPDPGDGNGTGALQPVSVLPWHTPWRVVIVGDLRTVVGSTLVTDVARPAVAKDTSWIKPGRVSWGWWSDQDSPQNGETLKTFVDLAAEMGWEYTLVDANFDIMDNGNIHDVLRHAKAKNVGVLLWYNSGGEHNIVTERPRGMMDQRDVRRYEFERLRKWGVKGVKVDFFQSDKQNVIELYQAILADAADYQIMVNFHGCTIPRGWSRTYPNLMSMEAVRGEECYIFDRNYPERAPWYNTVLVFTRNVIGPMDYTPVAFSDNNNPHRTTNAHELALSVVFESGWVHFADSAKSYRSLPAEVKAFLRDVPAAWDDTRLVEGFPGKYAVVARKKGDVWYIGGINGEGSARKLNLDLAFAGDGALNVRWIADGKDPRSFQPGETKLTAGAKLNVEMLPFGGFVATVTR